MKMTQHRRERGVVLVTTLLILVVMLIGAVALVRSFDTSLVTAGNLSFKRELAQQSELAAENILRDFRAGGVLASRDARGNPLVGNGYSSLIYKSNAQGIPLVLLDEVLQPGVVQLDAGRGITLRYVVDRLCSETGNDSALGPERCVLSDQERVPGGSSSQWQRAEFGSSVASGGLGSGLAGAVPQTVVYRISIRASGPRRTESFFQTTFGCCDD